MSTLKVRIYGDPCLRKKCEPIKEVGPPERTLIKAMLEMMYENKGIGLAAPQVGILKRLFVVDVGLGPVAVINPKILKRKGSEVLEEGCLSIPEVTVNVKRPVEIRIRYTNEDNQTVEKEFFDMMARVILHENDHLNGKLIVDYAGFRKKFTIRKQLKLLSLMNKEG